MFSCLRYGGLLLGLPLALAAVPFSLIGLVVLIVEEPWCIDRGRNDSRLVDVARFLYEAPCNIIIWFTCKPCLVDKKSVLQTPLPVVHTTASRNPQSTIPQPFIANMSLSAQESPPTRPPARHHSLGPGNGSVAQPVAYVSLSKCSFAYEVLAIATNNFSQDNLLGEGCSANVYKGTLSDGQDIAIKHLKDTSWIEDHEFLKEAEILGLLHHRHLVSLVGCCSSERKRLLVYEYVPNGTLEFHLHEKDHLGLDWLNRYKVSLGCAKGLAYLHEDCQPRIIHRDIKASNILLTHSFEAKIADFGFAKHFPDNKTHLSTRAIGSLGYVDPEYASTGQLTDKSDVFSFGVVLLELITGRRPIGLADWARPLLKQALHDGKYDGLVDPQLRNDYNSTEIRRMIACADACVCYSASHRPLMSQIVRALEGLLPIEALSAGIPPSHNTVHNSTKYFTTMET